ncbi:MULTISPECIES: SirB2 family protein [Pseudoalteromonas]|nr:MULTISPECIES: SirB2 family protein [Pseudoalteromonas]MDW7549671.1 SirB2 family protein [Pseudoalteromonas peptidolytica]NLR13333.1 SirB2 family protein [Pseudoalteromonas peptidolytica]RRS10521.1 transcriptional regulator [Pseudoalteromonas sp. J010]RXF00451.1 transcriptional regulator [Pseudoalteromonas sp. PS5]USD29306.1 SirB2 family protein [Pseudoalteromonas sp. SCSIO 43201]
MDYMALKHTHLLFVVLSIVLFYTRAFSRLGSGKLAANKGVFITSHSVDTLLLITAVVLAVTAGLSPGQQPWLLQKIILVFGYIALGFVIAKAGAKKIKIIALGTATLVLLAIAHLAVSKQSLLF